MRILFRASARSNASRLEGRLLKMNFAAERGDKVSSNPKAILTRHVAEKITFTLREPQGERYDA
jgi:hypothetical protein